MGRYLAIAIALSSLVLAETPALAVDDGPAEAAQSQPADPAGPDNPNGAEVTDAPPAACTREDFETVVDQAAAALRDLNLKNKPALQEKLRQLKAKRGWSEDQFLEEAAPFVKDETIDELDQRTQGLLQRIVAMGDEGSAAATPDCNLFATLRAHMNILVDTQNEKWTYMFRKIDAELSHQPSQ